MKTKTAALLAVLLISPILHAEEQRLPFHRGDGRIVFYNYHTGDLLETAYRKGGKYNKIELKKIAHIFRSRSDEKEHDIDTMLIELLDNIQDHFGADAIELISGYRSPELNKQLKKGGINVAEESLHMEGRAADIHIDEVTEEAVRDYLISLKAGGAGFYPANDFVHVDTGEVRRWSLPDRPGRLLMAFQKSDEWQILTDKDVYFPKEAVKFEVMNITRGTRTFKGGVELQIFRRGEWKTVNKTASCSGKNLPPGRVCGGELAPEEIKEFGKYRLVFGSARSNEFYRKKL